MKVSALHPLIADLARQVGGERVEVYDLVGEGGNPHRIEPRPADMREMQSSAVILASGMGLETYIDRLESSLEGVTIIEVGKTIPPILASGDPDHVCSEDHDHSHGDFDPHWWQSVDNMRRATRVVAVALAEKDPEGKEYFMEHANAYGKRLDELKRWAKVELAKVPRDQRKLVTAHNAFAYFAKEFGFDVIPVAGLNKEQSTTPHEMAATIEAVRKSGVKALFPETGSSVKTLKSVSNATGTRIAEPLIADGNGVGDAAGFEGMIRHNVSSISTALTP